MTRCALLACAAGMVLAIAVPAVAEPRLAEVRGHLVLGYAKLFADEAPAGSLSVGAGIDHPVGAGLRAGLDVGYHLLGTHTLVQGSLSTGLSYSLFEALAQIRWAPAGGVPVQVSGGPGVFVARASLGSSPGGAIFSGRAVEETRPGLALGVTLARVSAAPVRLGLEAGLRVIPLESSTWTLAAVRVAILY